MQAHARGGERRVAGVVQKHLESFLAEGCQRTPSGLGYPRCVEADFRVFLQCGIPPTA